MPKLQFRWGPRVGWSVCVLSGLLALSCALPAGAATKASSARKPVRVVAAAAHAAKPGKTAQAVKVNGSVKQVSLRMRRVSAPARPSFGETAGLRVSDELALKSSVALVMDQDTSEVLFSKNTQAVLPIASLTKLMTALVVVQAQQPLDEELEIGNEDIDTEKGSRSRLVVGTRLSRGELLHLALMSSENRAANALGRHYPGGLPAFVAVMNQKAQQLGMQDTRYFEPTGLSSHNQSSAPDLAKLVKAAYDYPLIRELSTSPAYEVEVGRRTVQFHNTNGLVRNPAWDIGLQKTGYIVEAGRCLVMQAKLAGRKLIMVFLDSTGKYSRIGDAERVRHWIESGTVQHVQQVQHPLLSPSITPTVSPATTPKPML